MELVLVVYTDFVGRVERRRVSETLFRSGLCWKSTGI